MKTLGLINNIKEQNILCHVLLIDMIEENRRQKFRLGKINETINSFIEQIEQKNLMSKKYKKFVRLWITFNNYLY